MLKADWLVGNCSNLIDLDSHIDTCRIDYCMDQREEILLMILRNAVEECIEENDNEQFRKFSPLRVNLEVEI